ncbi:uncharacterized protein DSM5745_00526 [Aspergillus mulundensis]|uniref:Uncharacterized protein n=1 Tax=Aspergillus mulundensis TaxID=1810919 RepID=A0A3D8T3S6_9EURO|nr:hypothetical protein DSM5745_00526 [Aspergillus mulundensis]RDW93204.1 hypothetical protein DSM5745_00526 [Aspergillus mulundensis]
MKRQLESRAANGDSRQLRNLEMSNGDPVGPPVYGKSLGTFLASRFPQQAEGKEDLKPRPELERHDTVQYSIRCKDIAQDLMKLALSCDYHLFTWLLLDCAATKYIVMAETKAVILAKDQEVKWAPL